MLAMSRGKKPKEDMAPAGSMQAPGLGMKDAAEAVGSMPDPEDVNEAN